MKKFLKTIPLCLAFTVFSGACFSACGGRSSSESAKETSSSDAASSDESGGTASSDANEPVIAVAPRPGSRVSLANDEVNDFYYSYAYGYSEKYMGGGDRYAMKPLLLSWESEEPALNYTIKLSERPDLSEPVYTVTTPDTEAEVDPAFLHVATAYYWQIAAVYGDKTAESKIFDFYVTESFRTISIDGVSNTRDLGGMMTESGKRIRQGLVYRGARLDYITEQGRADALKYGFTTDLDLRTPGEGQENPLGLKNYVCISAPYYALSVAYGVGIQNPENWSAIASEIRMFSDESNYPIYFHCSLGRDRTGTLAFLLEALLGVSEYDVYRDYEFSLLSEMGCLDNAPISALIYENMNSLVEYIKAYGSGTLSENCEKFLLDTGVTAEEIFKIRSIMLEESNE